jgi:hypothetical protein
MPYVKEDTYSNQNPNKLYAKAGTEVIIVKGDHGIFIVQSVDGGEKFCMVDYELTDNLADCAKAAGSESGTRIAKVIQIKGRMKQSSVDQGKRADEPEQASLF